MTWKRPPGPQGWPAFEYAETVVDSGANCHGQRFGETLWIAYTAIGLVGAAWQWTEISLGVVLLSDPNAVATNLMPLDDDRQPLAEPDLIRAINSLVHTLPWQAPVCEVLASLARR